MKNKVKVGIDINELIRGRSIKFDECYRIEFGDSGAPEEGVYTIDFFNDYKWEDIEESENLLNEMSEDELEAINPLDYIINKETGIAPIDHLLFKEEKTKLSAKDVYDRFLYQDFVFEIFASAPPIYRNINLDLDNLIKKYKNEVDFILFSKENDLTRPSTFSFLAKTRTRCSEVRLYDNYDDIITGLDVVITTDPELIEVMNSFENLALFKAERPYNKEIQCDLTISEVQNLLSDERFKIMVGHEEPVENN